MILWSNIELESSNVVQHFSSAAMSKISQSAVSPSLTEVPVTYHPWLVCLPHFRTALLPVFFKQWRTSERSICRKWTISWCWLIVLSSVVPFWSKLKTELYCTELADMSPSNTVMAVRTFVMSTASSVKEFSFFASTITSLLLKCLAYNVSVQLAQWLKVWSHKMKNKTWWANSC